MSSKSAGYGMLFLFVLTGCVLGGIIGELIATSSMLTGLAPYLVKTFPIFELPPVTVNLYVIKLAIGFGLYPNLVSILGMIIAIMLYRRF